MKKEILRYLTSNYNSPSIKRAKLGKEAMGDFFLDKDSFIIQTKFAFNRIVKGFLLTTRMKYSHHTASAFDAILAWVNSPDARCSLTDLYAPDYLFLLLDSDPVNSKYDDLLCSLLKQRRSEGKTTWIYSPRSPDSPQFKELYGENLSHYLVNNFETPYKATKKELS